MYGNGNSSFVLDLCTSAPVVVVESLSLGGRVEYVGVGHERKLPLLVAGAVSRDLPARKVLVHF